MLTDNQALNSSDEQLLQMLSSMSIQLNALQTLIGEEETDSHIDTHAVRNGIKVLEHMTREALYVVRASNEHFLPTELAGNTLSEVLSHLVEETAETLGISSRVSFSGSDNQKQAGENSLPGAAT
jgi:signal transduction histidine kinase